MSTSYHNSALSIVHQSKLYVKGFSKISTNILRIIIDKSFHLFAADIRHGYTILEKRKDRSHTAHCLFYYIHQNNQVNYLRVTLAPTSSSFFLISSASSLEACSLTTLGAPSTTSLASFKPRPVISRTTLITLTF